MLFFYSWNVFRRIICWRRAGKWKLDRINLQRLWCWFSTSRSTAKTRSSSTQVCIFNLHNLNDLSRQIYLSTWWFIAICTQRKRSRIVIRRKSPILQLQVVMVGVVWTMLAAYVAKGFVTLLNSWRTPRVTLGVEIIGKIHMISMNTQYAMRAYNIIINLPI